MTMEIKALYDQLKELSTDKEKVTDPLYKCPLYLYHICAQRNKRCLLAYLKYRTDALNVLRWQAGTIIPSDMKLKLSPDEIKYFEEYDNILGKYMGGTGIDLFAVSRLRRFSTTFLISIVQDLQPPKSLYIEVRVLQDYGEILTDSGTVNLEKNTTHFLRRSDVEHLICQNVLKQISS